MAAINSPAKVLKLWNRVNDRFGPSDEGGKDKGEKKKVSEKDKAAEKQNEKITKGLTVLKAVTKGGVKTPSQVKKFESTRGKVLLVMKKYCKTIKSVKLEGAQDMNKFRKNVKQLTVVVEQLNPMTLSEEEGEDDLGSLLGVDTASLDAAMEKEDFAAGDDNFTFDETGEDTTQPGKAPPAPPLPGTVPTAPPLPGKAPPASKEAADFLKRIEALEGQAAALTDAEKAKEVKLLFSAARMFERKSDYAKANETLDRAEKIIKPSNGVIPPPPPQPGKPGATPSADGALAGWQTAREKAVGQLRQLAGAIAKSGDPEATPALVLVNAIIKNLSPAPATPQSVKELERYVSTDDIIGEAELPNNWGVTVQLRTPLLAALQPLKKAHGL